MFAISKGVKIEIIFSIIGSLILWMAKLLRVTGAHDVQRVRRKG